MGGARRTWNHLKRSSRLGRRLYCGVSLVLWVLGGFVLVAALSPLVVGLLLAMLVIGLLPIPVVPH